MTAAPGRVLIVESRYYPTIADPLLDGAIEAPRLAVDDVECEADGVRWAREADSGGAARACLELMALRTRLLGS